MGYESEASGVVGTAFGIENKSSGFASTTFGKLNKATGEMAIALGYSNKSRGVGTLAAGTGSTALGRGGFAVGANEARAIGMGSIATGGYVDIDSNGEWYPENDKKGGIAWTNGSIALGTETVAGTGTYNDNGTPDEPLDDIYTSGTEEAVAMGYRAKAVADKTLALGFDAKAEHTNSVALG
ncbi:hypothetical protein QJU96_10740, partial [Pasteurella skyensis]